MHILFCFISWKTKYLLMTLIWFSQFCSSRLGADLWVFNFWEQFGYFVVIFVASLQCSVLVHSGGVHGGHYYAFIRPKLSDQWYIQFNIWIKLFFFRYLNTHVSLVLDHILVLTQSEKVIQATFWFLSSDAIFSCTHMHIKFLISYWYFGPWSNCHSWVMTL